jgi:hypothetical protein
MSEKKTTWKLTHTEVKLLANATKDYSDKFWSDTEPFRILQNLNQRFTTASEEKPKE